jgi:hypothetical protein
MELRDRIESCLASLAARREAIEQYEARVRSLMAALKERAPADAVERMLSVLQEVLHCYREISRSCIEMIDGLAQIGRHVDRIEEGRVKIVTGVEAILAKLSQLESLAGQGVEVGVKAPEAGGTARPRRILVIRIRPDENGEEAEASGPPLPGGATIH